MNIDKVIVFLKENGYKEYDPYKEGIVFSGQKNVFDLVNYQCESNEGITMNVEVFSFQFTNRILESITISIIGKQHGLWLNLGGYSISFNEIKEKLNITEKKLIAAWNAAAMVTS